MTKKFSAGIAFSMAASLGLTMVQADDSKAENVVLSCTTHADGIGLVRLIEDGAQAYAKINFGEADEEEAPASVYKLRSSLRNIKRNVSDTLVGQKVGSEDQMFGGAIGDALLMRVLPGQKKAYLSVKNWVYDLHCWK